MTLSELEAELRAILVPLGELERVVARGFEVYMGRALTRQAAPPD